MGNLSLICGLWEHHTRKQVAKEQESWHTVEAVFKSINRVTMMEERSKAYHQPEYDSVSPISIKRVHEVSIPNRNVKPRASLPNQTYSNTQHNPSSSSSFRNAHQSSSSQFNNQSNKDQGRKYNCTSAKMKCYYCKGDHHLKNCDRFSRDQTKYKLKSVDMFKKC